MNATWKKLQVKDHSSFIVVGLPGNLGWLLDEANEAWAISQDSTSLGAGTDVLVAFVDSAAAIADAAPMLDRLRDEPEPLVWICYPKKSSRRLRTDISRDHGWAPMLDRGWEGVRQVAIDDDWSALRFREKTRIGNYTRKSEIGR